MTPEKLVSMALEAMQRAYAPYSGYKVGAALLCRDGSVVCGANIENAAYGPSNCAERTAIFTAVKPSPLWAARTGLREIFSRPAACAGR